VDPDVLQRNPRAASPPRSFTAWNVADAESAAPRTVSVADVRGNTGPPSPQLQATSSTVRLASAADRRQGWYQGVPRERLWAFPYPRAGGNMPRPYPPPCPR